MNDTIAMNSAVPVSVQGMELGKNPQLQDHGENVAAVKKIPILKNLHQRPQLCASHERLARTLLS